MSELPSGWVETTVETILATGANALADGPYGSKLKSSHYTRDGVRVIRLGNIGRGHYLASSEAFISSEYYLELTKHEVVDGDIVLAALGDPIGRCCVVPPQLLPAIVKADCFRIRLGEAINTTFFLNWMNSDVATRRLSEEAHGVGRLRINLSDLRGMTVPLPPLAEQKRIVAKLDVLNAKSARARTELARIDTLVSRYKQAVLSKAFSGELYSQQAARSVAAVPQETAEQIDGRTPDLPALPETWRWVALSTCAEVSGGLTKNAKRDSLPLQVPYLRVANVYANELRLDDVSFIGCTESEVARTILVADDLLVVEGNGSLDQIGRVALWAGELEHCVHQNHLIKVRPSSNLVSKFALYWLLSPLGRRAIEAVAASSSGLHTLSLSKVGGLPLPLAPLAEQHEIVRRIEAAFAKIDRLATEAKRALELVGKLDEAILAKAFRGELVPQDENDEPAEHLLARIRAEREAAPKGKRAKRTQARHGSA
jgi:type I restriction enzyme S subunit